MEQTKVKDCVHSPRSAQFYLTYQISENGFQGDLSFILATYVSIYLFILN